MEPHRAEPLLEELLRKATPGLQYLAVDASGPILEYSGGLADIRNQVPVEPRTRFAAYSMSKTITAAGVLLLVQDGLVGVDDPVARYLSTPYNPTITIRQLLTHTAGIPNPIPLRWVHLAAQHGSFDEAAALKAVLRAHSKLTARPGTRYAYSNIGYWLLGGIIERAAGQPFTDLIANRVLAPLGIAPQGLSYELGEDTAAGYLEKYSWMNVFKRLLIDRELIGGYEGCWLRIEPHCVNGPAFGGLVGTSRAFGAFLQDQLRPQSALFSEATRELFFAQQRTSAGTPVPMTPGWHIGHTGNIRFHFKEGGGGGFHCMMRVYREIGIGTVVMANATGFDAKACLDAVDRFLY